MKAFFVSLVLGFVSLSLQAQVIIPSAPSLSAKSYILMDANSGEILVENNIDQTLPPASITKLLTSYIVSNEIAKGAINLDDQVLISVAAWKKGGSKMFIREGTRVSVEDLIRGMIIQSGNDATIALAEHVAGSEDAFVDVMNQQAALLGMTNSNFKNATGWPDEDHYSTASDIALLAQAMIRDFPETYKIYSEKYFSYNGINQANRNRLLFRDKSVDGVKTGHTEEAGYCLVASSERDGMRLISVVLGTASDEARAVDSQKLLSYGFRYYKTHQLYNAGEVVTDATLWKGLQDSIKLGVSDDLYVTIPRGAEDKLEAKAVMGEVIEAPVAQGDSVGEVVVSYEGEAKLTVPLLALESADKAGFVSSTIDGLKLFARGLFE